MDHVNIDPELIVKAIEFGGFRSVTHFNVKNVGLGDRTDSTGREWTTFNYNCKVVGVVVLMM
jgi:hypothetical protein